MLTRDFLNLRDVINMKQPEKFLVLLYFLPIERLGGSRESRS
jgi:hypothetical protein